MSAKDPENGRAIAEADVRANIVTFINAGHETTANALTWTLFLLSQSPEWRERAEADADQAFDAERSGRDGKVRNPSRRLRGGFAPLSPGRDARPPGDRRR